MPTRSIEFTGSLGAGLAARLELPPDGEPSAWALFAHCFTCSKNLKAAVNLTRALCAEGIAVLRFDFTGLGESEGDFADTNFSSNVDDLVAAADYLAEEHAPPQLLVGHSLGGAAVLHAARRLDSVRAVATIGSPADPEHVLRHIEDSKEEIEAKGEARVAIGGRPFTIRRQFLEDLRGTTMEEAVRDLGRALMIMHAPLDEIVDVENAARLYGMAKHPKSFLSLDDADHLLTEPADSEYAGRVLAAWASRYVEPAEAESGAEELREGDRVVTRIGTEKYRTEVRVRRHALVADEPESVGGADLGPSPYDLVVAGLGACTAMTLRMYADRKGWPLDEVTVRLEHRKIHREDCEECEEGDERLDEIAREVAVSGELDDEQRSRLLEIADRCPVHRTLEGGARIETSLAEE